MSTEPTADGIHGYPKVRATGCPFDPPPLLRALQSETPVTRVRLWDSSTPWLITGYHEERTLLADPQISNDTTLPHYPHPTPSGKELGKQSRTFINMDDPEPVAPHADRAVFHQAGGGDAACYSDDGVSLACSCGYVSFIGR